MRKHVQATIFKYGEKLESFDLKRFNSYLIDPIKLIFDKSVYRASWEEIVNNEVFRQRDKSNNNDIGYFHQNIFSYFNGCEVPQEGWDVIYRNQDGIVMPDGDFYKMCMALPEVINAVVREEGVVTVPSDTVVQELQKVAELYMDESNDIAMAIAVYMLGFSTYFIKD